MSCKVGVFFGEGLMEYSFGEGHPFSPERVTAFYEKLKEKGILSSVKILEPVKGSEKDLLLFHGKEHVEFVKKMSDAGEGYLDFGDTPAARGIFEGALYAVGTTIACFDVVLEKKFDHAFNPVGGLHHARKNRSAGFCVFNDIDVLINHARKRGLKRILYVDIDAHHGDGVYYEFEEDPDTFILDLHEDGRFLYPGTGFSFERGKGKAEGTKLNIPMAAGSTDKEFLASFEKAKEFIEKSRPELIILQAGGDGIAGDPITHLAYSEKVHREVSTFLHKISHKNKCYYIGLGGGGYNIQNTASAWAEVIKGML